MIFPSISFSIASRFHGKMKTMDFVDYCELKNKKKTSLMQ